jgi:hypothetical protein
MKEGRKDIKELTHFLTTEFDISEKLECLVCQTGTSGFFSTKMVNNSKWRTTLYISQVGLYKHVFQVMRMFVG